MPDGHRHARWTRFAVLAALLAVGLLAFAGDGLRDLLGAASGRATPIDEAHAPLSADALPDERPRLEGPRRPAPSANDAVEPSLYQIAPLQRPGPVLPRLAIQWILETRKPRIVPLTVICG